MSVKDMYNSRNITDYKAPDVIPSSCKVCTSFRKIGIIDIYLGHCDFYDEDRHSNRSCIAFDYLATAKDTRYFAKIEKDIHDRTTGREIESERVGRVYKKAGDDHGQTSRLAMDKNNNKNTTCKRCKKEKLCDWFTYYIGRISSVDNRSYDFGHTLETKYKSTYSISGKGGGYLCQKCQWIEYLKELQVGIWFGILPIAITVILIILAGFEYINKELCGGIVIFLILYSMVFGFKLLGELFNSFFLKRTISEYCIQNLSVEEIKQRTGINKIYKCGSLPLYPEDRGIRLFTTAEYKSLD